VLINRPGEVWIETTGGAMCREPADELTEVALQRLARQIAAASHQGVNREQPLLSATLPDGARVQVVSPPATRGGLALAVRKHLISRPVGGDLARDGLFDAAARADPAARRRPTPSWRRCWTAATSRPSSRRP
jgi:type IV secretion system protein VirB11